MQTRAALASRAPSLLVGKSGERTNPSVCQGAGFSVAPSDWGLQVPDTLLAPGIPRLKCALDVCCRCHLCSVKGTLGSGPHHGAQGEPSVVATFGRPSEACPGSSSRTNAFCTFCSRRAPVPFVFFFKNRSSTAMAVVRRPTQVQRTPGRPCLGGLPVGDTPGRQDICCLLPR